MLLLLLLLLLLLPARLLWAQEGAWWRDFSLKVQSRVKVQEGLCVHVPCVFTTLGEWTESDAAHGYCYHSPHTLLLAFFRGSALSGDPRCPAAPLPGLLSSSARPEFANQLFPRASVASESTPHLTLHALSPADPAVLLLPRSSQASQSLHSLLLLLESPPLPATGPQPDLRAHPGVRTLLRAAWPTSTRGQAKVWIRSLPWSLASRFSPRPSGGSWWLGWAPCEAPGRPSVLPGPESRWTEPSGSEPGLGSCPLPCLLITQAPVPLPLSLRLNLPPLCLLPCPSRNRFATLTLRVFSTAPTALANGSSLPVVAGQALRLLCAVDSDPPARLTWSWGNLTLCPSEPANPGVLELTPQHLRGEGEFTCRAQNSLGSQRASLSLSLQADHEGLPPKGLGVTGVTLGAVAGAGTTALLFLSFCIVLVIIWSCRKKSAKPAASKRDPIGTSSLASQGPLVESQPDDSSSHQPPPSVTALSSEEEEEIHYASLSFHRVKPRDPQDHQSITSEYSEIKIHE
ncbi:sialic acid-binding Ig-like lectin 8 [Fukomys damarensis]|uniref:sialic acid-binding Ig-like lectin 8 n=1 Tax=Fukomys damarensis TaxID=885580 RepID=UPI001455AC5D|nr:sialic acid-binding Ig-like lectin 8 [Fukomys damarensis]